MAVCHVAPCTFYVYLSPCSLFFLWASQIFLVVFPAFCRFCLQYKSLMLPAVSFHRVVRIVLYPSTLNSSSGDYIRHQSLLGSNPSQEWHFSKTLRCNCISAAYYRGKEKCGKRFFFIYWFININKIRGGCSFLHKVQSWQLCCVVKTWLIV